MDVPEASKHGKKSTVQKLEDQKKVGRIYLLSLDFLSAVCVSAFAVFHLYLRHFLHRLVCCSLHKRENMLVQLLLLSKFPVAPLLHIS